MELATQADELVRGVFAITMDAGRANTDANPPVVHLAGLAEVCRGRMVTMHLVQTSATCF